MFPLASWPIGAQKRSCSETCGANSWSQRPNAICFTESQRLGSAVLPWVVADDRATSKRLPKGTQDSGLLVALYK